MSKKKKSTITNAELATAYSVLGAISDKFTGIVTRFRVLENLTLLETQRETWLKEYQRIIKENVTQDEKGEPATKDGEYVWQTEDGKQKITELNGIKVDVNYVPLSLRAAERDRLPDFTFSYELLVPVRWMFNDDADEIST